MNDEQGIYENSASRRTVNFLLNVSQFIEAIAFGLFIVTRGLDSGTATDLDTKETWAKNLDKTILSLFFINTFSSILSSVFIQTTEAINNTSPIKRARIASLMSAGCGLFLSINNICYLALPKTNDFRKKGLPWLIMLAFAFSKIRDIYTINPAFGGEAVITNANTEIDDRSQIPKNAHRLLLINQIFEMLTICGFIITIDFAEKDLTSKRIRIGTGILSCIGAFFSLLTMCHYLGSFYCEADTVSTKVVGFHALYVLTLSTIAAVLLFSDPDDPTIAPEVSMILIGVSVMFVKLRDIFTIDPRYGGNIYDLSNSRIINSNICCRFFSFFSRIPHQRRQFDPVLNDDPAAATPLQMR